MNTRSAAPQYQKVTDTLRGRIIRGEYRKGDVLPTAAELEQLFSVSNITIRKALAILSGEGIVSGRRGVGTVVTAMPKNERVKIAVSGDFTEWVDTASGKTLPIEQEVLECSIKQGPAAVAKLLGAKSGEPLWSMRRLRRIGKNTISYHVNYGLPETFRTLDGTKMPKRKNFVDAMRDDCGIVLKRVDQTVEAMAADCDIADLLDVEFGTPMFYVENRYTDENERIVAVSHLYLRGDHYAQQTSISLDRNEEKKDR